MRSIGQGHMAKSDRSCASSPQRGMKKSCSDYTHYDDDNKEMGVKDNNVGNDYDARALPTTTTTKQKKENKIKGRTKN